MLTIDRGAVLAFRAGASHLHRRLPPGSIDAAAYGGLQDSAPRAALISLHARVGGVTPSSWEDEALCQIWGPRGADYIVPRRDVAVFTLGRMPRDPKAVEALNRIADDVHGVCQGSAQLTREVGAALPDLGHSIRAAAITGRLLIRWDARSIWVVPTERPDADPEDARLELARRFFRWFAPTTRERLAWWSGVDKNEALTTWEALREELLEVELDGEQRFMLREQEEAIADAEGVSGVRLIPHGDPYIKTDGHLVVPDAERRPEIFPQPGARTAFWPVSGAVVADGAIVGAWARQQRRITVHPWLPLDASLRGAIELEALAFPIQSRSKAQVRWVR